MSKSSVSIYILIIDFVAIVSIGLKGIFDEEISWVKFSLGIEIFTIDSGSSKWKKGDKNKKP